MAVSSDRTQAPALDAFITAGAATTTRLEPINSVKRVIEDHIGFQGYSSNGATVSPTNTTGLFNLTATNAAAAKLALDSNVIPFTLADVALYVITSPGNTTDRLYTANPFTGGSPLTVVSSANNNPVEVSAGNNNVQDIVMRSDGVLYGYARLDNTDNAVGRRVIISTETGTATDAGNDNIPDRNPTPNYQTRAPNNSPWFRDVATTDNVDALTYKRLGRDGALGTAANYDLYYVVRESDTGTNSKLYRANADTGSAARAAKSGSNNYYGERGDIQPAGVSFAWTNVNFFDSRNSSGQYGHGARGVQNPGYSRRLHVDD